MIVMNCLKNLLPLMTFQLLLLKQMIIGFAFGLWLKVKLQVEREILV